MKKVVIAGVVLLMVMAWPLVVVVLLMFYLWTQVRGERD